MNKTIFRLTTAGLILAALIAFGAAAAFAQDPCTDAAGQTAMQDEFDKLYADKVNLDVRQKAIDSGKAFLDKYGACDSAKERADWLRKTLPGMETRLAAARGAADKGKIATDFDNAMKAKNWDAVYSTGKIILDKYPTDFSAVELVLGSIGYDELFNNNTKYSDQTLQYAKQSLADLQAGKDFKPGYGVTPFIYKSREDATAWMNLTIGTIYQLGKKDKASALPYLYEASKAPATSDVSKNPNPYEFIGNYYFDQLNKIVDDIKALSDQQNKPGITEDELKSLVDQIKAKVALSNGISERAMDAFARAYSLGTKPDYKAKMKANVAAAYKVRYGTTGPMSVDQWIASAASKPFVNPTTPVTPISDPEPVKTTTGADAGTTVTKPAVTTTPAKNQAPAKTTTTAVKKPGVAVTKTVVKKRGV